MPRPGCAARAASSIVRLAQRAFRGVHAAPRQGSTNGWQRGAGRRRHRPAGGDRSPLPGRSGDGRVVPTVRARGRGRRGDVQALTAGAQGRGAGSGGIRAPRRFAGTGSKPDAVHPGPAAASPRVVTCRFGGRARRRITFSSSAREGGTDAKRRDAHPAPSRPVPGHAPTTRLAPTTTYGWGSTPSWNGPDRVLECGSAKNQAHHGPAARRADHGFDAQAWTRIR